MKNKLLLTLALGTSTIAQAHGWEQDSDRGWRHPPGYHHHQPRPLPSCLESTTTNLGSHTEAVSGCELIRPLKLASKEAYYPNLRGNIFNVEFWDGAYGVTFSTTTTYQTIVVNKCSGETLVNEPYENTTQSTQEFAVENPNLDSTIKLSFELSPLTSEEAVSAMAAEKAACESARAN